MSRGEKKPLSEYRDLGLPMKITHLRCDVVLSGCASVPEYFRLMSH